MIRTMSATILRSVRRPALLVLVAPALMLTACSQPPWQQNAATSLPATAGSVATPKASTTPKTSTSTNTTTAASTTTGASTTTAASTPVVHNDLAKGSVERKLSAGGVQLTVHYWSTLPMDRWTATATKPLSVSVTAKFADGSKQDVYLNSLAVSTDVTGVKGQLQTPAVITDQASVAPGYEIKAPGSYGNVIDLPAVDAGATSLTLNLNYQVLAQTAPNSKTYLKQAAGDTVVIALAH